MGLRDRWREVMGTRPADIAPARKLDILTGFNVRELGGYDVEGGTTAYHRFLRSGGLDTLSLADQDRLYRYGVRMVVDLRGDNEMRLARDKLTRMPGVRYLHAPLFDLNISDPKLERVDDDGSHYTLGYLTMLGNHEAIRRIFSFFATAQQDECVLFHCAAGMDRTGMTAMLLLGLVGASRRRIIADYCYSFATEAEVDRYVFGGHETTRPELLLRRDAISITYDRLIAGYGSVHAYLEACGVTPEEISLIRAHLLS